MRWPTLALLLPLLLPALQAHAREQVRIVGSSTLFPFAALAMALGDFR